MHLEGRATRPSPEQVFATRISFRESVGRTPAGDVALTVRFDSAHIESTMLAPEEIAPLLARMRGVTGRVVYDDLLTVRELAFPPVPGLPPELLEQLGHQIRGMTYPLPKTPVGVGDSWTSETELPVGAVAQASGPLKAFNTITVKELHAETRDTTVLLAVETSFPGAPITITAPGASGHQTLQVSGKLAGEQLFSLTRGAPVHASLGGNMRVRVEGGPQGEMAMSLRQVMSLELAGTP